VEKLGGIAMKKLTGITLLLLSQTSYAGVFVDKSMYVETYLAVGHGKTKAEAMSDAQNAIPEATKRLKYEPNSQWASPAIQCLESGVWTEENECYGNDIQYIIPLKKIEQ
jgi:hypothetical protein